MVRRSRDVVRAEVLKRVVADPEFRGALRADVRGALKDSFGYDLGPTVDLRLLEDSVDTIHIVLPPEPPERNAQVTLREITADEVYAVSALEVRPDQQRFVAPNAVSLAEARFVPAAWTRAIYAGDTPVGFVMLSDDPEQQRYFLWRYMIDYEYQGLGFGRRAMGLVIEYVRGRPGASELRLSYVPGEGSPRDFYRRLGFEDTEEMLGGERVMCLRL